MSKMSDLALQLDEQAVEYGLQDYQEALEQGFTYEVGEDGTAKLISPSEGLEMAHEAWLEEKKQVLEELEILHEQFVEEDDLHYAIVVAKAIRLIEEGEY